MSKNWYEISIKELVEEFMRNHGYNVEFDRNKIGMLLLHNKV